MPPIPDSPSTSGSGTSAPKRSLLCSYFALAPLLILYFHSHIQMGSG
jgi:hypothetical protein